MNLSFRPIVGALPCALAALLSFAADAAETPADQFAEWSARTQVSREMTLRDLGFKGPLVLSGSDSQREIYLPVPAGVPISDAQLQYDAGYLRGNGGRSSQLISIDGDPVAARRIDDERGSLSQVIGIDGLPRESGFVRFGVGWWSVVSDLVCSDQSAPANVLRVGDGSRFSYSVDRRAIDTLGRAWSVLPMVPVLLIDSRNAGASTYDAAWRVGAALERSGKRVRVLALPQPGEEVDLAGIAVPQSLQGIPAFAALAGGGRHRLADPAELGALLALGEAGPLRADVLIDSPAMRTRIAAALDALDAQVAAHAPDAAAAYARWRAGEADVAAGEGDDRVRLGALAGNPVIVVAEGAGARAAGLFSEHWRTLALGTELSVAAAQPPQAEAGTVLLSRFGNVTGTLDIVARGDRTATFDLDALGADGGLPTRIVFDVSAAPNAGGEAPVASVSINDFLLGAQVLRTDGQPQRIDVAVPRHALAARNEVRITFLRQPTQLRCHDQPTAYPVSVLPSSHLRLAKGGDAGDFVGVASRFASGHDLLLPDAWLQDAPHTLQRVIRVANAVGASLERATLKVVADGEQPKIGAPFLAFDARPAGLGDAAAVRDGRLVLADSGDTLVDLGGLDRAAVVEVARVSGNPGVLYSGFGGGPARLDEPFRLMRGTLAVLDGKGALARYWDARDPTGARLADEADPRTAAQRHMPWLVALVALVLFALFAARVAQIRRRKRDGSGG